MLPLLNSRLRFVVTPIWKITKNHFQDGEKVEIDAFKGAKAIKRTVAGGDQIFHLDGDNKGSFVDAKGKKIESTNYEANNGILIIKKFTKADVGTYSEHPAVSFQWEK